MKAVPTRFYESEKLRLTAKHRFLQDIPERLRLAGGPYRPPRVPKSGFLRCALRGWTKVDSYTAAPISMAGEVGALTPPVR